ncbi:DNA cytosine methyltransferase [Klebsiella aerogenes]|nr:DNA cytosine methyltransferase [Klebsiella aerogenes]
MYNEIDPYAAEWLRNLIKAGHIAPGVVDERSIEDVTPDELREFTQCHFFAGVGVWSYALRRAGWPDDRPVWSGSCPCQPFSSSGKGEGFDDDRHLWPAFAWHIAQRQPVTVFGEQVASNHANEWFDLVQSDLERMGYAFGLVPFPSAGIGAPHIRDRAYWVADANSGLSEWAGRDRQTGRVKYSDGGHVGGMADTYSERQQPAGNKTRPGKLGGSGEAGALADTDRQRRAGERLQHIKGREDPQAGRHGEAGRLGDANGERLERHGGHDGAAGGQGAVRSVAAPGIHLPALEVNGFWRDADWLYCRDGNWRPVEPGAFPLVDGAAARMGRVQPGLAKLASRNRRGRLKGYGNAINAEAARVFIRAYLDTESEMIAQP